MCHKNETAGWDGRISASYPRESERKMRWEKTVLFLGALILPENKRVQPQRCCETRDQADMLSDLKEAVHVHEVDFVREI